jgi:hypothetical protein
VVVIVPVDADVKETQDVAQKDRKRGPERFDGRTGRNPEVQTIIVMMMAKTPSPKSFQAPSIHRGRFACRPASDWARPERGANYGNSSILPLPPFSTAA